MNSRSLLLVSIVLGALSLSACNRDEPATQPVGEPAATAPVEAPAAAATAGTASAATAPAPITQDSPIWFEPASMSDCAANATATIHWNATSFGVKTVKVALPGEKGTESVFAVSAPVGQKVSGPWMHGGSEIILRDAADDRELARAKMPGEPCAK